MYDKHIILVSTKLKFETSLCGERRYFIKNFIKTSYYIGKEKEKRKRGDVKNRNFQKEDRLYSKKMIKSSIIFQARNQSI
jgi:hypothetical protein